MNMLPVNIGHVNSRGLTYERAGPALLELHRGLESGQLSRGVRSLTDAAALLSLAYYALLSVAYSGS